MKKEEFKVMVEELAFTVLCGYEDNGVPMDTQIKERYDEVCKAREEIREFIASDDYSNMFDEEDEYHEFNDDIDDMIRMIDIWIANIKQKYIYE